MAKNTNTNTKAAQNTQPAAQPAMQTNVAADTSFITPEVRAVVDNKNLNTSQKIRELAAMGLSRGQISRSGLKTGEGNPIRYQHVRNVLVQPVGQSMQNTGENTSTEDANTREKVNA